MKEVYRVFGVFIFIYFINISSTFADSDEVNSCKPSKSCGECISLPQCAWCEDPNYTNSSDAIPRCDLPENLKNKNCPSNFIRNPQSRVVKTEDEPFSIKAEFGKANQIRPQVIDVDARPGQSINIQFSYKQVEDYPVDLYYLLDLSQSMKDDLANLRSLGKSISREMKGITQDFSLGFGSFVDKTVMPYISTLPEKLANPCTDSVCQPSYGYHNSLPLTNATEEFEEKVNETKHSSNQDNPEGSLDAMMQAIVCKEKVGWRPGATHLLLLSTDANFHYAGDGKLGGIVTPNDGECHLDDNGIYVLTDKMDYPSIGHLVQKISDFNIQPIFAVTQTVKETYDKFAAMIPKSVVAELKSDSSNIVNLIKDAYINLKEELLLEFVDQIPPEVLIFNKTSICPVGTHQGNFSCNAMKINSSAEFSFNIKLGQIDQCYQKPIKLSIKAVGYDDSTVINIHPICDCKCEKTENAPSCSNHGRFECGACNCDDGYSNTDCSCNLKEVSLNEKEPFANCTMPGLTDAKVCSGRGECLCGVCSCNYYDDRTISGKYCECDSRNCPRFNGKICNDQGVCKCGKCECFKSYTGEKCECSTNQTQCFKRLENGELSELCYGHGNCTCNKCECETDTSGERYRGFHCENAPSQTCGKHQPCLECKAFGVGKYNKTEDCTKNCPDYEVKQLANDEAESYRLACNFIDNSDGCVRQFWYLEKKDKIYAEYRSDKKCEDYFNPTVVIIGVMAAVVGIGIAALLIWKGYTSMKDAAEYKNFIRESQNVKFEGGENPIYKQATSTFQNPTFKQGGKSSSGL